jgi:cytochrome c553
MFHRNSIISTGLALCVVFSSAKVFAEVNNQAAQQPSSQESANKQSADETKLRIGPGDPVAGKNKAALCFGCHGEDGNSTDPQIPKLAGQYGIYIAKQVRNYLSTTRSHMIMSGMAASVRDEDLDDIAAYFASQPMMKGDHPSDNRIGKKLFENDDLSRMMVRCNNCHGAAGKGQNPGNPVYPVIGGQHKEYLLAQLHNFRKGLRNNSPGGVMNITVHRLSDAELEALADYISAL